MSRPYRQFEIVCARACRGVGGGGECKKLLPKLCADEEGQPPHCGPVHRLRCPSAPHIGRQSSVWI